MDEGFNFRSTSGYVADGADEVYVLQADTYPTTRGGVTFGWTSAPSTGSIDRNSGIDARLAGIAAGQTGIFRVDLDASGSVTISLALGDANGVQGPMAFLVKDDTTTKITLSGLNTGATEWADATGVVRTSVADWIANHAKSTQTFGSTTLLLQMDNPAVNNCVAHMRIETVSVGAFNPIWALNSNQYLGPKSGASDT